MLGIIPLGMALGTASSVFKDSQKKHPNMFKTGMKAIVGVTFIGATSEAISKL